MTQPTVLLGMSGGVDSSVAAALLVEQGYHVQGVTLQLWETEDDTTISKRWQERGCCKVGLAKHVAQLLKIPHHIIQSRDAFEKGVIDDFIGGYLTGTTPNPCVRCNERVKFAALYQAAKSMGAEYVATGHYANIGKNSDGSSSLLRAKDSQKDQSYFLYRLPSSWLPHLLFPLGTLQKSDVWKKAEAMGLPSEGLKESQEICFVTKGDYRTFLQSHAPESSHPGPFMTTEGKQVGEHQGIAFYTPGQRRGLGIATGERLYVQKVIPETNTVVVGPQESLACEECLLSDVNIYDPLALGIDHPINVKIRYATPAEPAIGIWQETGTLLIRFHFPQQAVSPGQSAVLYQGDRVIGGGIIQGTSLDPRELITQQEAYPR